jgi:hypothetical protein
MRTLQLALTDTYEFHEIVTAPCGQIIDIFAFDETDPLRSELGWDLIDLETARLGAKPEKPGA